MLLELRCAIDPQRDRRCGRWIAQADASLDEGVATDCLCPEEDVAVEVSSPAIAVPGKGATEGRQELGVWHLLWPKHGTPTLPERQVEEVIAIGAAVPQLCGWQQAGLGQPWADALGFDD